MKRPTDRPTKRVGKTTGRKNEREREEGHVAWPWRKEGREEEDNGKWNERSKRDSYRWADAEDCCSSCEPAAQQTTTRASAALSFLSLSLVLSFRLGR